MSYVVCRVFYPTSPIPYTGTNTPPLLMQSFNFVLQPLKRLCFFETLKMTSPAHRVEAFVLSGGDRDVLLTFHGPLIDSDILKEFFEEPIFHETIDSSKEMDSETLTYTTEFKPDKPGTYAICLDNRNSRFMSKVVQLDVRPVSALEEEVVADAVAAEEEEEEEEAEVEKKEKEEKEEGEGEVGVDDDGEVEREEAKDTDAKVCNCVE
jgi:hypothetical protein